ncbi:MAG: ribonuclease Z [Chloroflexota bacterium]
MSELIVLGSANAVTSPGHANTHLLLSTDNKRVLIDCGTNPVVQLQEAGCDINSVTDIILTHMHPDHVSGFPILLMDMWLTGRKHPINVYGLSFTLERIEQMMSLYNWHEWPDFFQVNFFTIPSGKHELVLQDNDLKIISSPAKHFLPNICLRMELQPGNKNIVYSCDTEPSLDVQDLAQAADILIHEATGNLPGHSSALQAAEIAQNAGVKTLFLIHYPVSDLTNETQLKEAANYYSGKIIRAVDSMRINLDNL